jgi:uncharacterized protein YjbI with pentapeptide repeats
VELHADCGRCAALCCTAPAFAASADFALDKPAGQPCPHLSGQFRCGIHSRLRASGFPGCAVYDCFGAGQRVTQETFGGRDWRQAPDAARMFAVFGVMRQLHEMLWYLGEAVAAVSGPLRADLRQAAAATGELASGSPGALAVLDVAAHRQHVNALLLQASVAARAPASPGAELRGADLAGQDLRGSDLSGASLRGACLIGTDLRGAALWLADLTGADLRGARLDGADLGGSLFLTQSQLDAAAGDAGTRLPDGRSTPRHWPAAAGRPSGAR